MVWALNLVQNHIVYSEEKIEETLTDGDYPEIYIGTLPEADPNYMARADEIRTGEIKFLSIQQIACFGDDRKENEAILCCRYFRVYVGSRLLYQKERLCFYASL